MMKAIHLVKYGEAKTAFKNSTVALPKLVDNDSVLIKVHGFGINFADVMARKGLYNAAPNLPAILGYEVVGVVEKVNNQKNNHLIGKRVVALTRFGGYAEYAISSTNGLTEINKDLPMGKALALATQYCTALLAMNKTGNLENEYILIHSASGGVGVALTQLSKLKNCKIIGLTRSPSKIPFLTKNGVDYPILNVDNNYQKKLSELLNTQKISAIFNSVGGSTFKEDLKLLDSGGHLVFFGISERINSKKGFLNTLFQMIKIGKIHPAKLILNSQSINGLNLLEIADKKPQHIQKALKELISLLDENKINPHATNEFGWNEIAEAHDGLEKSKFVGKVFINLTK